MRRRRSRWQQPPLRFGVAAYVVLRDTEQEARHEIARITRLRPGAAGFDNFGEWVNGTQLEHPISATILSARP